MQAPANLEREKTSSIHSRGCRVRNDAHDRCHQLPIDRRERSKRAGT